VSGLANEDEEIKVAVGIDVRISDKDNGWFSHSFSLSLYWVFLLLLIVHHEPPYLSYFLSFTFTHAGFKRRSHTGRQSELLNEVKLT
jgi:hypothetical protein